MKAVCFHAAEAGEELGAAHGIVDLEHHRRDQFAPVGHEGVIGREFAGQLLRAALLDVQHLLDLHPHGLEALEMQRGDRAHFHAPHALQRHDGLAARRCGGRHSRWRAGCRMRRSCGPCSGSVGAGEDLDGMRRALRAARSALASRCPGGCGRRPAGIPRRHGACRLLRRARHGLADLERDVEVLLEHAEGAAMARAALDHVDRRSGISFSISAALGPIFWARAWQARCT